MEEIGIITEELSDDYGLDYNKVVERIVEKRLAKEISQGMQCFDYQNSTLCSSVGQAVFLTVSVYLNEDPQYTDDLILIFKDFTNISKYIHIKNEFTSNLSKVLLL